MAIAPNLMRKTTLSQFQQAQRRTSTGRKDQKGDGSTKFAESILVFLPSRSKVYLPYNFLATEATHFQVRPFSMGKVSCVTSHTPSSVERPFDDSIYHYMFSEAQVRWYNILFLISEGHV